MITLFDRQQRFCNGLSYKAQHSKPSYSIRRNMQKSVSQPHVQSSEPASQRAEKTSASAPYSRGSAQLKLRADNDVSSGAALLNSSPPAAAQRKSHGAIENSPRVLKQQLVTQKLAKPKQQAKESESLGSAQLLEGAESSSRAGQEDVQLAANDKHGENQQLDLNKGEGKAEKNSAVSKESVGSAEDHPYFPAFSDRIHQLFNILEYPGEDPVAIASSLWSTVLVSMGKAQAGLEEEEAYSDFEKGYLNMAGDTFQRQVLGQFGPMEAQLQKYSSTQFAKAKSFGFWSTKAGKELAESVCDLTLETSGIGALFDELPSLDAQNKSGWDVHLWASLSKAYGNSVGKELTQEGKMAHICLGPNARSGNIFETIESIAMKKNLEPLGIAFESVTRFHAAAAKPDDPDKINTDVQDGDYDGTTWSGAELQTARDKATAYWDRVKLNQRNTGE